MTPALEEQWFIFAYGLTSPHSLFCSLPTKADVDALIGKLPESVRAETTRVWLVRRADAVWRRLFASQPFAKESTPRDVLALLLSYSERRAALEQVGTQEDWMRTTLRAYSLDDALMLCR